MINIAYFDCYSGASGDMLLGSLLDKSVDFSYFLRELKKLNIPEESYEIKKEYVNRSSIDSCKINIELKEKDAHHRSYNTISNMIKNSSINDKAKQLSLEIFYKIAVAEAKIHNTTIEKIHFHEVGAMDSIIDIIGFSICYSSLNINYSVISPIPVGSGSVCCDHGTIPVPAPATIEILKNSSISIKKDCNIKGECLTPTAAAILTTIVNNCGDFPSMKQVIDIGYGAGTKVFAKEVTSNLRFIRGISEENTNIKNETIIEATIEKDLTEEEFNLLENLKLSNYKILKDNKNTTYLKIKENEKKLPETIKKMKESGNFKSIKYYKQY